MYFRLVSLLNHGYALETMLQHDRLERSASDTVHGSISETLFLFIVRKDALETPRANERRGLGMANGSLKS